MRNVNSLGLQCEKCGSKIFFKERPNVKKVLRATLRITGAAAQAAVPSFSPEAGRELPRTETDIRSEGDEAIISITATDTSAMRAAINSYLECIRIIEDIDYLTRVRS